MLCSATKPNLPGWLDAPATTTPRGSNSAPHCSGEGALIAPPPPARRRPPVARPRRRAGSHRGGATLPELVAQDAFEELPGVRPRQFVAQLVLSRALVTADARFDEPAKLVEVEGLPRLRLD